MIDDPIVAEVRSIRAKMLRECGGDMHKLIGRIHRQTQKLGLKTVSFVKQRPGDSAKAGFEGTQLVLFHACSSVAGTSRFWSSTRQMISSCRRSLRGERSRSPRKRISPNHWSGMPGSR